MKIQPVRGTHDLFGEELNKTKIIENIIRKIANNFDFNEIITPIFESSDLFIKPLGEHSDVVLKEMYTFNDRNKILVDYLQSPECYKLFGVNNEDNVKLVLQHRIKLLSAVARSPLGYKHVISGFDESKESSDYDIWLYNKKVSWWLTFISNNGSVWTNYSK